jgi:archaellum component FlaC
VLKGIVEADRRGRFGAVKVKSLKEAKRISDELSQIETIVSHVKRDWNEFVRTGDDAYLKAVAYDLHGFYTGLEHIFESVADTIDDQVPEGGSWHKALLDQMGEEIEGVRPALLSNETRQLLDEFMRFRHRVRNIYSFNLIPERVKNLVEKLPGAYEKAKRDLSAFAQFLEQVSSET